MHAQRCSLSRYEIIVKVKFAASPHLIVTWLRELLMSRDPWLGTHYHNISGNRHNYDTIWKGVTGLPLIFILRLLSDFVSKFICLLLQYACYNIILLLFVFYNQFISGDLFFAWHFTTNSCRVGVLVWYWCERTSYPLCSYRPCLLLFLYCYHHPDLGNSKIFSFSTLD